MAGLAAAVSLAAKGLPVTLYEAAPQAGGRCRSFHDSRLGCLIDNGNHLVLSGNDHVQRFLATIGAPTDALIGPDRARLPFVDLATGDRWVMRPNAGPLPWWVLARPLPGVGLRDYLPGLRLLRAGPAATVADCYGALSALARERFWDPLVWAVMNTVPEQASAQVLARVLRETFAKGERACRPLVAREGLGPAFVDPAVAWLERQGAAIRFRALVGELEHQDGRVSGLVLKGQRVAVAETERVILAVPPAAAARLLPGLVVPEGEDSILNAHFRLPHPPPVPFEGPLLGVVRATTHWIFVRDDVISLTVSAANSLGVDAAQGEAALLSHLWQEVRQALALPPDTPQPPARLLVERRATFHQSPDQVARRPSQALGAALSQPQTRALGSAPPGPSLPSSPSNLALAGDWTDTGLPATIEGSLRSGYRAATSLE